LHHKGGGKIKQSKKRRGQQRARDLQLIYDRIEDYNHLISIGYLPDQAIKKLKAMPKLTSVEKLDRRYQRAKKQFGALSIDTKGISLKNKDVKTYIKRHHLTLVGDRLYLPGNIKMDRPKSPYSIRGGVESTKRSFHEGAR